MYIKIFSMTRVKTGLISLFWSLYLVSIKCQIIPTLYHELYICWILTGYVNRRNSFNGTRGHKHKTGRPGQTKYLLACSLGRPLIRFCYK